MTKKSTKDSNKSRKSEIKEPPKRAVSEAEPAGNDMDDLLSQYLPADGLLGFFYNNVLV